MKKNKPKKDRFGDVILYSLASSIGFIFLYSITEMRLFAWLCFICLTPLYLVLVFGIVNLIVALPRDIIKDWRK